MSKPETMMIDNVRYVREDSVRQKAEQVDGMNYVLVRTCSAGVHAGYLASRAMKEVVLVNSRRLWYWEGAASLSQLAMEGTSMSSKCKFPCAVDKITLTEAVEVIACTEKARKSIQGVSIWKA